MDDIMIVKTDEPKLKDIIFIEGLPGVGNVGKLAAEHLISQISDPNRPIENVFIQLKLIERDTT